MAIWNDSSCSVRNLKCEGNGLELNWLVRLLLNPEDVTKILDSG